MPEFDYDPFEAVRPMMRGYLSDEIEDLARVRRQIIVTVWVLAIGAVACAAFATWVEVSR